MKDKRPVLENQRIYYKGKLTAFSKLPLNIQKKLLNLFQTDKKYKGHGSKKSTKAETSGTAESESTKAETSGTAESESTKAETSGTAEGKES